MNKKIKALLGLLAFVTLIAVSVAAYNGLQSRVDAPENLMPGTLQRAYDFAVVDSEGNEVRLSDFFGKPIVLNFWTTWCPACVRSSPYFEQLYRERGNDIHILKVNLPGGRETRQAVDEFIAANGYTFPVYFDIYGEAARAYGIRPIPDTVFINTAGYITTRIVGAVNERALQEGMSKFEE
ncbi:MAG: TlpA family protein disulfide reductase [Defluviitaleaceae bacterium]|nr:TlpA family protein disulfide reductase [Defluviitaleaceae bacterium]